MAPRPRRIVEHRDLIVTIPAGTLELRLRIDWSKASDEGRKLIEDLVLSLFRLTEIGQS